MNGRSASPDVDDRTELRVDRQRSSSISNDVIASSPSQHPQHRGPQPISPPPPSPQISAADLLLLTEASATHNGTFQCTLCSKQFGYKNGLIRHVRLTHVGEKPYQCSICNRRFGYKHILMEHQNLHFGNRPYACHLCDKRFAARSNLIQHRMVHRRPYSCALCSKRFDREDQLKKHLFAHPQSHVGGLATEPGPGVDSPSPRHNDDDKPTDSVDAPSPSKSPRLHQQQAHVAPGSSSELRGSGAVGHRIDAICSHLITSRQHTPQLPQHPPALPANMSTSAMYDNVVVKKELDDSDTNLAENSRDNAEESYMNNYHHHHHQYHHHTQPRHHSPRTDATAAADKDKFFNTYHSPPHSALAALTDWSSPASRFVGGGIASADFTDKHQTKSSSSSSSSVVAAAAAAALPGIHEVFSKRQQRLPSFANFMPLPAAGGAGHKSSDVPSSSVRHSQSTTSGSSLFSSSPVVSLSGVVNPTQRPTAQLPPMTHGLVRSTKDQAVQHSQSVAGFPSLDDVLSYYVSQGRLFRCQHCSILFFERGMYFLHASLHGLTSPWECSICHKVCSDKNEFTLHFVNQQHNP